MSTGNRIKERREALGLSRKQLGERMGMTRMSIYRVEAGITRVQVDDIEEWAAALRVPKSRVLAWRLAS